jgi:uncharacterized protein YbcI
MTGPSRSLGGVSSAAISNALVGLYRRHFGKGPAQAKTYLLDDVVICLFEGGTLRIEETLEQAGQSQVVDDFRRAFRRTARDEFVETIEQQTGRQVRASLSQYDSEHDIACWVFLLAPTAGTN